MAVPPAEYNRGLSDVPVVYRPTVYRSEAGRTATCTSLRTRVCDVCVMSSVIRPHQMYNVHNVAHCDR